MMWEGFLFFFLFMFSGSPQYQHVSCIDRGRSGSHFFFQTMFSLVENRFLSLSLCIPQIIFGMEEYIQLSFPQFKQIGNLCNKMRKFYFFLKGIWKFRFYIELIATARVFEIF